MQDVALLAVGVGHERDSRGAIRVVLDRRDLAGDVRLVPLEVDDAVVPLVAAAAPPRSQVTVIVAATRALERLDERLVRLIGRDLVERLDALELAPGRRGLVVSNRHVTRPP